MAKVIRRQLRQGDVLLTPMESIPAKARLVHQGDVTLALGEATGHAHRLLGDVEEWRGEKGVRYVLVREGVITHEEHDPIPRPVAPGAYQVIAQQTLDLTSVWRRVQD